MDNWNDAFKVSGWSGPNNLVNIRSASFTLETNSAKYSFLIPAGRLASACW
jgi:hypothetical protein